MKLTKTASVNKHILKIRKEEWLSIGRQNGWITQEASKPKKAKRGRCVFPSDNPKVTDNKDHYPYNSLSQARNALSRMMQHDGCPKWYKGTLDELRGAIKRSVYKAYPGLKNRKKERDGK